MARGIIPCNTRKELVQFLQQQPVDLVERLKASYPALSDSHKRVAEYLLDNVESAAFLTAGRLGAAAGVSESTVVRFAMALGYQGWPDLQRVLAVMVRARLDTVTRLRMSSGGLETTVHEVLTTDAENLQRTMSELDPGVFGQVVDTLTQARDIYVLGLRSAQSLAVFLTFYLQTIGKSARMVSQGTRSAFEELDAAGAEDVVLAISFPRYSSMTVRAFQYAKDLGAKTIALTDSAFSPLAQAADLTLVARTGINSFIESFVAPLSVINAIITAIGRKDEGATLKSLEKFEEICAKNHVYWPQ
ncbi:MAG: MurR/RpiR family transcriptional regulator [Bacillota bacterium]|nr:MurR/RpiR family transcriptional regulator [Bacillota bacterium]